MKNLIATLALLFLCLACTNDPVETEQIAEKDSSDIPALLERHENLRQGKEWDSMQSAYGKTLAELRKNPEDKKPYLSLAQIFINEARITGEHGHYYPAALKVIEMGLDEDMPDRDLYFRLLSTRAAVELSQHDFTQALATAEKAVAINPYNAQIYGALVDANVELGNYEEAVAMADKMVSIKPDLRSYSRVSYMREIHGDVKGAIDAMQLAVDAGYPGYESTAWARLTLGELYETYGEPEKARMQYELALNDRPDYPFAIAKLANLEMDQQQYERAEGKLNRAAGIIPEFSFYEDLARIYRETGRTDEFEKTREEILLMLEDDVASGHQMDMEYANLYLDLFDNPQKALAYAKKEYDKRPENIDVNRLMAKIYMELEDYEKLGEHLTRATKTQSKHPELSELQAALAMK